MTQPSARNQIPDVADAIVARIAQAYSRADAQRDGIRFWPDPLPGPNPLLNPDPLVLFQQSDLASRQRSATPMDSNDARQLRGQPDTPTSLLQIPLGLVDIPEAQEQKTFEVRLHGLPGTPSGGPVLIAGAQNSGKATALHTMLLWMAARYAPEQAQWAVIDPNFDLDLFRDMPHVLRGAQQQPLWTDGASDEAIKSIVDAIEGIIAERRRRQQQQRSWDAAGGGVGLRIATAETPAIVLIISLLHTFAERFNTMTQLKKLVQAIAEAQMVGVYAVITTAELDSRQFPSDLLGKMGTKIGLLLNDDQRYTLLGRTPFAPEPYPGRGMVLLRDRSLYEVQVALAVPGASERHYLANLKQELDSLRR